MVLAMVCFAGSLTKEMDVKMMREGSDMGASTMLISNAESKSQQAIDHISKPTSFFTNTWKVFFYLEGVSVA